MIVLTPIVLQITSDEAGILLKALADYRGPLEDDFEAPTSEQIAERDKCMASARDMSAILAQQVREAKLVDWTWMDDM